MWRKNRSVSKRGGCIGVDLNRNFDANWCSKSSSHTTVQCKEGNVREGKKILYVFVRSNFPEMMTQCLRIITDYYYF